MGKHKRIRPYSYASASIGSLRDATQAGYSAPHSAPANAISVPQPIHAGVISIAKVGNFRCSSVLTPNVDTIPTRTPATASTAVSRRMTPTIVAFDAPIDFRIPISRVRSSTAVYIDWKITRKPTITAIVITTFNARSNPGNFEGV